MKGDLQLKVFFCQPFASQSWSTENKGGSLTTSALTRAGVLVAPNRSRGAQADLSTPLTPSFSSFILCLGWGDVSTRLHPSLSPPVAVAACPPLLPQEHPVPEKHHPLEPHLSFHPAQRHVVCGPAHHEPRGPPEQCGASQLGRQKRPSLGQRSWSGAALQKG